MTSCWCATPTGSADPSLPGMAADDPCGPAIDFDNTGCLRISGTSLFFCFRHSLPFRLFSRYPFTPFFLQSVSVSFRPRPWRFASVCLLSLPVVPIRASNPLPALSTDAFRHPAKNAKGDPQGAAFGRKGRSAAAYSSAASGRITTFTRLLSSRIFWASFCTSAFETVRMACSPLAT